MALYDIVLYNQYQRSETTNFKGTMPYMPLSVLSLIKIKILLSIHMMIRVSFLFCRFHYIKSFFKNIIMNMLFFPFIMIYYLFDYLIFWDF